MGYGPVKKANRWLRNRKRLSSSDASSNFCLVCCFLNRFSTRPQPAYRLTGLYLAEYQEQEPMLDYREIAAGDVKLPH